MKIRQGFVSNSSSSSFIVAFSEMPSSKEELQKMLFGDEQSYFGYFEDQPYPTSMVAETVWNDMQNQCPNDAVKIGDRIGGYFDDMPANPYDTLRHKDFSEKEWNKILDDYYEEVNRFTSEKMRQFMDKNKGCFIYVFEYSDNEGDYQSALEHGRLFHRLVHLTASHH